MRFSNGGAAHIAQAATLEEAKELGIRAAAFVKENGEERGAAELNSPIGEFSRGPLYVTLHDFSAAIVQAKDPVSGKHFNKDMIEIATTLPDSLNMLLPKTRIVKNGRETLIS